MSYFTESNDENDLVFLYHHPSCYKKYAEYKKLPILHETVSNILVGTSSQQLLSWLIFPTTQEGPDYDLRNVLLYTSVCICHKLPFYAFLWTLPVLCTSKENLYDWSQVLCIKLMSSILITVKLRVLTRLV